MANDGDHGQDPDTGDDGDNGTDDDHLRELIREELSSVLDEFRGGGGSNDDPPADDDGPVTVKGIEAATERAVRKAMDDLQAKARRNPPKNKPPTKTKADPEPVPVDPPSNWLDKVRKAAWS